MINPSEAEMLKAEQMLDEHECMHCAKLQAEVEKLESVKNQFKTRLELAVELLARYAGMSHSEAWLTIADKEQAKADGEKI